MASTTDTVLLHGGLVVPVAALDVLLDLERRGCTIRREPDGRLFVGPRAQITADDDARIRQHRDALIALVTYCDQTVVQ